jgi:sulfite exporter TauE/SafE
MQVLKVLEGVLSSSTFPLLSTGVALGAMHSFAPDHLAAVGVFVSRRPQWQGALAIGARWGVGHSVVILVVGGALVLTGWRFPDHFAPAIERIVGLTLIGLGVVALVRALRVHAHVHEHHGLAHWHLHSHRRSEGHDHTHHAALGMGMLHGLAGTGALVIALPLAATKSASLALAYLVAFGTGTTVAMATFGAFAGWAVHRAGYRSVTLVRATASVAALASVVVGVWWTVAAR